MNAATQYHSARGVVMDLAANLYKERLQRWVGAVLVAGDERLGESLHPAEVRKHYRSDARTWELLLRMRLADRWFHRRVLRRRYGSLLPAC
ncbi:MAG: hypothetical protein GY812_06545 [Actinomycetia bacterium]|nr:hypothetical protein [Actinomycetes bacterium]